LIDLHFHCLPGIDDGPADWAQAVALCRAAAADGSDTIAATSHVLREPWLNEDPSARRELVATLNAKLGGTPRVVEGCEYFFSSDAVELWEQGSAGPLVAINNGSCLLLEFAIGDVPAAAESVLYELALAGVRPLIAHPERNHILANAPDRLRRLVDLGALLQITAGSILGRFGSAAARAAEEMLQLGVVTIVASDAHSVRRPPEMGPARERVEKEWGALTAERLFERNPQALLEGTPLS
jgi:protein-tyrosine phosphatase